MSFLGLRLPHETARLLSEIEVPGKREDLGSYHITLLFLGDDVSIPVLSKALEATYAVSGRQKPFTVRTSTVTCFPGGADGCPDGCPIICKVDSDDLHKLQRRLKKSFDKAGVTYSKNHKIFQPHVTLSYSEEPIEDFRIPTVEWGAHELVLWGGDSGDSGVSMTFPFTLVNSVKVARRFLLGL